MHWNTRYLPPDPHQWRGRPDTPPASCFFQILQTLNLLEGKYLEVKQPSFAILGFRCDEGIKRNSGRIGAAEGPAAIRHALGKLPIHKHNFYIYDAGSIACADGDLESSQQALGDVVALLLQQKFIPIILGGGREVSFGHYLGINHIYPTQNLGLINIGAHFEMRSLQANGHGTSGSPFLQIALHHRNIQRRLDYNCLGIQQTSNIHQLFEAARHYNAKTILADDLHLGLNDKCTDFINRIIDENELIYMSLSLDVFASAFAPGVSASQPLGLFPWHIIPILRQLASSGKLLSWDLAELSPRYDVDQRTAKLTAMLIYEFIHHYKSRNS